MATGEEPRCADCLNEFRPADERFIVIKSDESRPWTDEERQLSAHLFEAMVCVECIGWYGGEHFAVA